MATVQIPEETHNKAKKMALNDNEEIGIFYKELVEKEAAKRKVK